MKQVLSFFILLLIASPVWAQQEAIDLINSKWDAVLKQNVVNGEVDYRALVADEGLKEVMSRLRFVKLTGITKKSRLAFLLNVYNASVMSLITKNYPVASINDIKVDVQSVFDYKFIEIDKKTYSLNDIEHNLIRDTYMEPRIHFVISAAAKSGPKVKTEAFSEGNLEKLLEECTREFINNPALNSFDLVNLKLNLNMAFKWYEKDFGGNEAGIIKFIASYLPARDAGIITNQKVTINYLPYDWALNDRRQ